MVLPKDFTNSLVDTILSAKILGLILAKSPLKFQTVWSSSTGGVYLGCVLRSPLMQIKPVHTYRAWIFFWWPYLLGLWPKTPSNRIPAKTESKKLSRSSTCAHRLRYLPHFIWTYAPVNIYIIIILSSDITYMPLRATDTLLLVCSHFSRYYSIHSS